MYARSSSLLTGSPLSTLSSTSMSAITPPRSHRKKLKVKTGCITCRIRKVKCDEVKPSCNRCTHTGRKCDGYAPPPTSNAPKKSSLVVRSSKQALKQSDVRVDVVLSSIFGTPEEHWSLDFFIRRTAPAISGAFDTGFWTYLLPQLSQSEDAIRHALLAVGSLHAQYESRTIKGYDDAIISESFAIRQYNQAINILNAQLSGTEVSVEATLVCCLLFVCLECLGGNQEVALNHLHNGLNILRSALAKGDNSQRARSSKFGSNFVEENLNKIFSRLSAQLTLFGKSAFDDDEASEPTSTLEVPLTFNNLSEAKVVIDILSTSALRFVKSTFENKYTGIPTAASVLAQQLKLLTLFLQWRRSFEILVETGQPDFVMCDQRGPLLLRIQYTAAYIWLSTCLMPNETVFDAFEEEFESIITWAQHLAQIPSIASLFSLDIAVIPPLYLTAIKCRLPWVRQKAIELLYATPGREGTWDAQVYAKIAERIVAIEGQALEGVDSMPSEEFRIKNADVLSDTDGDHPSHCATFYTKPNGLDEDWVIWKEEIIM